GDRGGVRARVPRRAVACGGASVVRRRAGGRPGPLAVPLARRPAAVDAPGARPLALAGVGAGGCAPRPDMTSGMRMVPGSAGRLPRGAGAHERRGERLRIIVAGLIARYPLGG